VGNRRGLQLLCAALKDTSLQWQTISDNPKRFYSIGLRKRLIYAKFCTLCITIFRETGQYLATKSSHFFGEKAKVKTHTLKPIKAENYTWYQGPVL